MAMRFNFITNKEGVSLIISELLDTLGAICYQQHSETEVHIIQKAEDFTYAHFQPVMMFPKSMEKYIKRKALSLYFSPVFEYHFMYDNRWR